MTDGVVPSGIMTAFPKPVPPPAPVQAAHATLGLAIDGERE